MSINNSAAAARENARRTDGKFGEQPHTDPGQVDFNSFAGDRPTREERLYQWMDENRVRTKVEHLGNQTDENGWDYYAYKYTFTRDGRQFTAPYGVGVAYDPKKEPAPEKVLDSVLDEASMLDASNGMGDWAWDLGYDVDDPDDYRRAQRDYNKLGRARDRLRNFLGSDYDDLADTEEDNA